MDFTALKTAIQNAVKLNGNEEITGDILQGVLLSMVSTLGDSAINDLISALANEVTNRENADGTLQTNINNEATTRGNADTALQNAINTINTKLAEGYVYVGIATTSTVPSTPSGKVFYIAVAAGTYTNFLDSSSQPLVLTQGINILKYNGTSWSVEQVWGVDDVPTASSNNLVKSGGVAQSFKELGKEFIEGRGGIKELYIFGDIQIDDLHLLYRGENNCHIVFFYDGSSVAETQIAVPTSGPWPSVIYLDYGGIIPIYRTSTIGSTNEIVGYICVDWSRWNYGTNVVIASLTQNVYELSCSPSIYNYLLTKEEVNKIKETNKTLFFVQGANFKTGTDKPSISDLSIPANTDIIIRCDCGERVYSYANIYIAENGVGKILTAIGGKGVKNIEYTTEGVVTFVQIDFRSVTTGGVASVAVLAKGLEPLNERMFNDASTFATILNTSFNNYAILCKCSVGSFYPIFSSDISSEKFVFKINHNFRENVISDDMTPDEMATYINYQFSQPINRFNDAVLNLSNGIKASINTQMRIGEPSAIVSDDMQTLYIYCSSLYRYKSTDGINYTLDHNLTIGGVQVTDSNPEYLMHVNVNYINGVYYLIGTHDNYQPLVLWTSTDGWNFTKVGTLLEIGDVINSNNDAVANFGNSFLHYEEGNGLWYLYYEMTRQGGLGWEISVATCPNIMAERSTGKYGVWTQNPNNPSLPAALDTYTQRTTGKGNPNLVCGLNNRVMKHNGKYYMYLHGNTSWYGVAILRYYSTDLINWTYDGMVYNNRDVPTAGEDAPGNGDHCIVEFKGRTLLFYTWDINDYPRPEYVKLTIDDRPLHDILAITA